MATKTQRITALALIAALTASSLSLPAMAQNAPVGVQQQAPITGQVANRITWSQMVKSLEDKGYIIREIETEHAGWKAEVFDNSGVRLKLYLDGQGNVVRQKYD